MERSEVDRFQFFVTIEAPSFGEAEMVMTERLDPDEDYGFEYLIIGWSYEGTVVG